VGMSVAAFNWRVRKLQKHHGLPSYRADQHRERQSDGVTKSWSGRTKKRTR
jgi:hypothetical protein